MPSSYIFDHDERTRKLVPWRLRGERFIAFVSAFAEEVQELEDAVWATIVERFLTTASGAQLDQYGRLLGVVRAGLNDDDYRAVLETTILVNRSSGEVDRLLTIATILLDREGIRYTPHYPAGFRLDYDAGSTPVSATRRRLAVEAIARARAAGIGIEVVLESVDPAFGFDDDPTAYGFDEGGFAEDIFAGVD